MSEKIYEYKDEQDWFIGQWGGHNTVTGFGSVSQDEIFRFSQTLSDLSPIDYSDGGTEEAWLPSGYDVTVIRLSSFFKLLSFIVNIIREETGRNLAVIQHQGAILVTEDERLLFVHLPKEGVPTQAFFGQANEQLTIGDRILIATRNEGKTKEFRKMFAQLGIAVENLNDYPDLPDVAETGMTFEENARLKAETIADLTGRMVLADDSGLKVDVLGGLPGVWSARFSGPDATDASNNAKLLNELSTVFDLEDRKAQFHSTLVVAKTGCESLVVEADWEGYIGYEPKGEGGFGYDPLFLVGQTGRTAAQLSADEKNQQSHRGLALKKLLEVFPRWQQTHLS